MPKISDARRAEVRARILDAARPLVARQGVPGTSMNEIVRASGLSKGAIYGHFPSKAELVVALQDRLVEGRLQETTLRFPPGASARDRVLRLVRSLLIQESESGRERARLTLQFTSSALASASLRAQVDRRYERVHRLLRGVLSEGRRSGEFRPDLDPAATATTVLALLDGLRVDWAFTSQDRFDPGRLGPAIERLLCVGMMHPVRPPVGSRTRRPPALGRSGRRRRPARPARRAA